MGDAPSLLHQGYEESPLLALDQQQELGFLRGFGQHLLDVSNRPHWLTIDFEQYVPQTYAGFCGQTPWLGIGHEDTMIRFETRLPGDLRGDILQLHALLALLPGLRLALLDFIRWHATDRERDSLLAAIPQDHHRDVLAYRRGGDQRGQIVSTPELLPIESDNHVTVLEPGLGGGTPRDRLTYQRSPALWQFERLGQGRSQRLHVEP